MALAGPAHHEEGPVSKLEVVPLPVPFPPWLDDEAPGRAERHDGHHGVGPQFRLVIGVEPHAVVAAPVAVGEDVVERHAGLRAHAREEPVRGRRERPWLERLPRVSVAEVAGPGDQAGLEDAPPEEHDLPLFPGQLVAECRQRRVGLIMRQPPGVVVEPGPGCEGDAHADGAAEISSGHAGPRVRRCYEVSSSTPNSRAPPFGRWSREGERPTHPRLPRLCQGNPWSRYGPRVARAAARREETGCLTLSIQLSVPGCRPSIPSSSQSRMPPPILAHRLRPSLPTSMDAVRVGSLRVTMADTRPSTPPAWPEKILSRASRCWGEAFSST